MRQFLHLSHDDRKSLVREAANLKGINSIVIEKDFWTCWVLGKLSEVPEISKYITLKGGLSLSKVFSLIDRYSDDIDLVYDRSCLGFDGDKDPERASSKEQRETRIRDLKLACVEEIRSNFLPLMYKAFQEELGDRGDWSFSIDENVPQTLFFQYPSVFDEQATVRIEVGARSDNWPNVNGVVTSYLENHSPISIKTVCAERTFWEKATILHGEYHRPGESEIEMRISRHYYDLYQMHMKGFSKIALMRLDLLERVAKHKSLFMFPVWERYEEARPGSLRLIPKAQRISDLKHDYDSMSEFIFGDPPSFDSIIDSLMDLENIVNTSVTRRYVS